MIKTLLAMLILAAGAGCTTIASQLPSVQYCSEVRYERIESNITLEAKCKI